MCIAKLIHSGIELTKLGDDFFFTTCLIAEQPKHVFHDFFEEIDVFSAIVFGEVGE